MKLVKIDEYLVVNLYSGKKKWLTKLPRRLGAYEIAIRIRGQVKIPDMLPMVDFGEIDASNIEAQVQASMG